MRIIAFVFAAFLAACGGNDERPAPIDPKPASAVEEERAEPALTERQVDQELDDIERQIESGNVEPRVLQ